jgi:hypothetical protein
MMNDPKAAELVRIRLKYDWIVLLFGLLCLSIQLTYPRNLDGFLFFLGCFVFVEVFEVSAYRKLQKGGTGYHMLGTRRLDQDDGFESVLLCIILESLLFFVGSLFFLLDVVKQNVTWF